MGNTAESFPAESPIDVTIASVERSIQQNNPIHAIEEIAQLLCFPLPKSSFPKMPRLLELLSEVLKIGGALEQANLAQTAAEHPEDTKALYDLGFGLIEGELPTVSASVLHYAYSLEPQNIEIVLELCAALEEAWRFKEAKNFLLSEDSVLKESFMARYLLGYYTLLSDKLSEFKRTVSKLKPKTKDDAFLARRLKGMLARAEKLKTFTPLDDQDLRSWHFVVTGSVLLHLSPHGFSEGMNGRYASATDTDALCKESLLRLRAVTDAWEFPIERILLIPHKESEILAHAAGRHFNVAVVPWEKHGETEGGLIPVYDLEQIPRHILSQLAHYRPGQILWAHAQSWTSTVPVTPDITSYLYQFNQTPWSYRAYKQDEHGDVQETQVKREDPIVDLADAIVSANLDEKALLDLDHLQVLARTGKDLGPGQGPTAFRDRGVRPQFLNGSPVPSNRFGVGYKL
jgi:hypothetical protein